MAMNPDQMALIKACSIKTAPDTVVIIAEMYHTEKNPTTNKVDRSKSEYRYEGRAVSVADLQTEIKDMEAKPTDFWKWPNLPDWKMLYCKSDLNSRGAKWLDDKLKKAVSLENGLKILDGAKRNIHTGEYDPKPSCKYDLTGYTMNGQSFSLTADALKALKPGDTFSKQIKKA